VGLKELIKIVLGFHVDQNADNKFSNWNADDLTLEQVKYSFIAWMHCSESQQESKKQ
jgi:hypothetical protein